MIILIKLEINLLRDWPFYSVGLSLKSLTNKRRVWWRMVDDFSHICLYLVLSRLKTMLKRLWVNARLFKSMQFLETKMANICCIFVSFSRHANFGIHLVWVSSVNISRDISALEKPKFITFCKKGKKTMEEVKLPVSAIWRNNPKQT